MDWEHEAVRLKSQYDEACTFIDQLLDADLIPEEMRDDANAILGRKF